MVIWKRLYTCYVRPHLEYAVSAWAPYLKADCRALEKVQRRATKLIHELRGLSYDMKCKKLGVLTLAERRLRGDLIQFFKIYRGIEKVSWFHPPLFSQPRASKRPQMRREIVRGCNQRHNFLTNRIASAWNNLPDNIINSQTTNEFKNKLDNYCFTATGRHRVIIDS